jgi:uncharacterized phage protein gp47/JayE
VSYRTRNFQELVDNVLTDLTGGIVDEPIVFRADAANKPFPLSSTPATTISRISGTSGGNLIDFAASDYQLTADRQAVQWLSGTRPDPDTTFFVDYYPAGTRSPITDRNVGSVARTITEAICREMAVLYGQLDLVYKSGFIDTAEGRSLDFLVSLLGVIRIRAGREVGSVVFSRSTPAPGDITVPAGTEVVTPPLGPQQQVFRYETTATQTMRQGQTEVSVPVRFNPSPDQQAKFATGEVAANAISLLPKPIVGIDTVRNPEATTSGAQDETDAQLRDRTRRALAEAGRSTIDALRNAVLQNGPGVQVVVNEMPRGVPGEVELFISGTTSDQQRQDIQQAVLAAKAAGVLVNTNLAAQLTVKLGISLQTADGVTLSPDEVNTIQQQVSAAIVAYINNLKAGESILRNAIVAAGMSDSRIRNVGFDSLSVQRDGLPDDTVNRFRDASGNPMSPGPGQPDPLANFARIFVSQIEKATIAAGDATAHVVAGRAETTTAVLLTLSLALVPTPAGEGKQASDFQPSLEVLVRGYVEAPQRGRQIALADLIGFLNAGSGLFQVKPFPQSSIKAEHVGTGLIELQTATVNLTDTEQAKFQSLVLSLG